MQTDRFGNPFAEGLPYARGQILRGTADDIAKVRHAWSIIRERRSRDLPVFNFSGLERSLRVDEIDAEYYDDELSPAFHDDQMRALALDHLGGDPDRHDVMVTNRLTGAIWVALQVLIRPGSSVIGVSASYSHPAVTRAVRYAGASFTDTIGYDAFAEALEAADDVSVVVVTRLAVSYQPLPAEEIERIIALARQRGCRIFMDDAGGARVGPAVLDQPRTLQFDVDAGGTGLDKYGTVGPRLGVLAGATELVAQMRVMAIELGMEARPMLYPAVAHSLAQYREARVRQLVETTMEVGAALRKRLGDRLSETPVIVQLHGDDILAEALERAGLTDPPIVPFEATAAVAVLLLKNHGMLTVHFAGLPPGTGALMIKFVAPELLEEFGGADAFAEAVDGSIDALAEALHDPSSLSTLLLG